MRKSANLSSYVVQCLSERLSLPTPVAADLGCGHGRHLPLLARQGFTVFALDIDDAALRAARKRCRAALPVQCDLRQGMPFKGGRLGLALAVHVPLLALVPILAEALALGGLAILESVGGYGENWRELPRRGALRRKLRGHFTILNLEEHPVGPPSKQTVTVRAFIQRISVPKMNPLSHFNPMRRRER